MKNVYLIITDLHYAVTKEHRLNYLGEVMRVLTQILDIREKYAAAGCSVKLVFLGDIIDGAITQADDAMRCQNLFRYYTGMFDGTYCVVGNHEVNNVVSNPFWFLVSDVEDKELLGLPKAIQPQGVESVFVVPEKLVDGEVTLYFNHYGVQTKVPTGEGVAIGLFHQNVGSSDICKMWGTFVNVEEAAFVKAYKYSFFGHMHLATGRYYLSNDHACVGEWLGSCVGTNVVEVETLPAQCNIPAILVTDGKFQGVEDNLIERSVAKDVIDYAKLNVSKTTKEMVAAAKGIVPKDFGAGTLYQSILSAADDLQLGGLLDVLTRSQEQVRMEYKQGLQEVLGSGENGC